MRPVTNAMTPFSVRGDDARAISAGEEIHAAGLLEDADQHRHAAHHHDDRPRHRSAPRSTRRPG